MGLEYQEMLDGRFTAGDGSGPRREGAVASVLFDVTDGAKSDRAGPLNTPSVYTDNAVHTRAELLDAIRNCRIGGNRVDGIDYLMHCFEKRIEVIPGIAPCPWNPKQMCEANQYLQRIDYVTHNNRFAPSRGATLPAGTPWSWGPNPYRGGYDLAIRRLWECNLFLQCVQ